MFGKSPETCQFRNTKILISYPDSVGVNRIFGLWRSDRREGVRLCKIDSFFLIGCVRRLSANFSIFGQFPAGKFFNHNFGLVPLNWPNLTPTDLARVSRGFSTFQRSWKFLTQQIRRHGNLEKSQKYEISFKTHSKAENYNTKRSQPTCLTPKTH